jgi:NAD(P)-dependent dehydrogenase (short-subunit alcohol dehydrogenase family)
MTARLHGSVALVTGATRGIGRSIAERLAAEGARVACADVSAERLEKSVAEMRGSRLDVYPYVLDVGNRESVHTTMRCIESDLGGPITTLVNNAVWARYQALGDIDEVTLLRMFAVGLNAIIWTTQAAAEQMMRGGCGSVINLSSAAAVLAFEHSIAYCALKAAVAGLTRAAAAELGRFGIRVNAIAPGMIDTPASLGKFDSSTLAARKGHIPLGRFGTPGEIASLAAFLASPDSSYLTGALVMADGGVTISGV